MILRQQLKLSVPATSKVILPANDRRVGLLLSSPPGAAEQATPVNSSIHNANTATTGVKLSYVVPAGKTATLNAATAFATAGTTQVSQLQAIVGGTTITLLSAAPNASSNLDFTLNAGDTIQWNCTAAVAATTEDYLIAVTESVDVSRITLGFDGPAVLDQGVTLNPGQDPIELIYEHIGQAIREEISAIASSGTILIGGLEFTEMDCSCPVGQQIERRAKA